MREGNEQKVGSRFTPCLPHLEITRPGPYQWIPPTFSFSSLPCPQRIKQLPSCGSDCLLCSGS